MSIVSLEQWDTLMRVKHFTHWRFAQRAAANWKRLAKAQRRQTKEFASEAMPVLKRLELDLKAAQLRIHMLEADLREARSRT